MPANLVYMTLLKQFILFFTNLHLNFWKLLNVKYILNIKIKVINVKKRLTCQAVSLNNFNIEQNIYLPIIKRRESIKDLIHFMKNKYYFRSQMPKD